MRRVIEPTQGARTRRAGAAGVPIVWTRHGIRGVEDGGPFMRKRAAPAEGGLRLGTWGFELLDELDVARPRTGIVEKTRLIGVLPDEPRAGPAGARRRDGADRPGVLTNQCVAATCKDALFRDFKPIVVEECTGTTLPHLHEPAIEMIRVGWAAGERALGEIARGELADASPRRAAARRERPVQVRRPLPARGLRRVPGLRARGRRGRLRPRLARRRADAVAGRATST